MRTASMLLLCLFMAACAAHHASVVRCDGPLVPINVGGAPTVAPLAEVSPEASRNERVE